MTLKILTKIGRIVLGLLGTSTLLGVKILGLLGLFGLSTLVSVYYFTPKIEKTSFLILGVSGPGHESSTLTDTMIFSSISPKGATLISIPRDIWYQPVKAKINTLYYYGQKNGSDMGLVKQGVFDILGQTVDHWVIIDFTTFEKVVDWVGGIEVYVDKAFDDYKYPIAGKENDLCNGDKEYKCRYEHIHFEKDWQSMNGETALKFVRSRNAEGDEGTDTARSKRQEKVIAAIKSKILSPKILFNFRRLQEGIQIVQAGIKTDLRQEEILPLAKLLLTASRQEMKSYVLDGWETDTGLLTHPKTHPSKQWILLPAGNSWDQVHQLVNCFLEKRDLILCSSASK